MDGLLTPQQIFDKVATHLLTQKKQCLDTVGCRYFDPTTGHRCAVGCLIPPDRYDTELEGLSIEGIIAALSIEEPAQQLEEAQQELLAILADEGIQWEHRPTLQLLQLLQEIHDHSEPTEWHNQLSELARNRRFTMPKL